MMKYLILLAGLAGCGELIVRQKVEGEATIKVVLDIEAIKSLCKETYDTEEEQQECVRNLIQLLQNTVNKS